MNDIHGLINVGVILVYVGISALISGPMDNRITSIIGPYIMTPVGFLSIIVGVVRFFSTNTRSFTKKIAQILSWISIPTGIMIILFMWIAQTIREKNFTLLFSNWKYLLIGMGFVILGYLLGLYSRK